MEKLNGNCYSTLGLFWQNGKGIRIYGGLKVSGTRRACTRPGFTFFLQVSGVLRSVERSHKALWELGAERRVFWNLTWPQKGRFCFQARDFNTSCVEATGSVRKYGGR